MLFITNISLYFLYSICGRIGMGNHVRPNDCGCFGDDDFEEELIPIPLRKIIYGINIFNGLAQVTMIQIYVNNTDKSL
jgi:hypothetical protein